MLVTLLPDTLDHLLLEASPVRTPGLHLSQIIRSICASLEPNKYKAGPVDPNYTDPGFTFERVLETAWASRQTAGAIFRPGEFTEDGIIMSPDYVDLTDPDDGILVESKMTEMSMVGCPLDPKFRKWLWQMGAYARALQLRKTRLHVLWLRGNYKEIRRAYQVFLIEWTQEELDHTWALLVNHARDKGWLVQTPAGLVATETLPHEEAA